LDPYALAVRAHHRCIRAAQEVCQLPGVGDRMIAEAIVYA
jgi:hypothetical protein